MFVGLVIFIDGEKLRKYLIPSIVWRNPNKLFTDAVRPEYGINIHSSTFPELAKYAFEDQIKNV